ncbi:TonB-dependent outer membrane receptor [Algibacter lectus]|uniref:TonB-dependent outer membrane receptor n=1 Tax=Algibacter lectus TaxID=221126 RepID=A0A090WUD7_9FLAO|nr:TonB-dependent outer membrane receptor [Algibacter lectus]
MLCFPVFLFSQEKLTGAILEANDNNTPMGLAGANVYWLNTSIGAVTDIDGKFSLPYETSYKKLVISYVVLKPIHLLLIL